MTQPDETGHSACQPYNAEAFDGDGVPLIYQHWSAAARGRFKFYAYLINVVGEDFPMTQAHIDESSALFREYHPDLWDAYWAADRRSAILESAVCSDRPN